MAKEFIVILGGTPAKDQTGGWRTTNFDEKESDKLGWQGDRLRVVAASYLYQAKPESMIISSGGVGQLKDIPDAPPVAEVIKAELIELGVPVENIILEKKSGNTFQQLQKLSKMIPVQNPTRTVIISNRYHLPRVQAMIDYLDEFKELKNYNLELVSAEEVVIKHDKHKWLEVINKTYASDEMKERIKLEQQGVKDIKAGIYKFK